MDGNTIKDIRNLFRLKKENEAIKNKISGDIRSLFELEWRTGLWQTSKSR